MTTLYVMLTLIFICTQAYMLRVIWKRGKEVQCWKKSCALAEERETSWYNKYNKVGDEFSNFRQKFYTLQHSRYRLATAIAKRRINSEIKQEAQEIIEE